MYSSMAFSHMRWRTPGQNVPLSSFLGKVDFPAGFLSRYEGAGLVCVCEFLWFVFSAWNVD
jgi:hypothetical protein